ncbi:MAG: hypothetical protein AAGD25_13440 [Cyanobacteria bacterium P01_F01_bin.150]
MTTNLKQKIKRSRKQAALKSGRDPGNRSQRRLKRTPSRDSGGDNSSPPSLLTRRKKVQPKRHQPNVPTELAAGDLKTDANGKTLYPVVTKDGQVEYKAAKIELFSGRALFPVRINGKLKYVPAQSEASETERYLGVFVREDAITQPSVSQSGPSYKDKDNNILDTRTELDGNGRTLFAVEWTDPATNETTKAYLPARRDATPRDLSQGRYIDDDQIQKPAARLRQDINKIRFGIKTDSRGRTLFAAERNDPETNQLIEEYLPKKADATGAELMQGKYIDDAAVETESIGKKVLNRRPKFNFRHWRPLIATELDDGTVDYLPRQSQATPQELFQGRYVEDELISDQVQLGVANAMTNGRPRYDRKRDRKLYPVEGDRDDNATALLYAAVRNSEVSQDDSEPPKSVFYLPRESEATGKELAQGFFLPDDAVDEHQRNRRRKTIRADPADRALRRSNRAKTLPAGVNRNNIDTPPKPVRQALDGTPLWDGLTPPDISHKRKRAVLDFLKARYNPLTKRILYQTEVARGQTQYLPLWEDATVQERRLGNYAAFVPQEPLADYLQRADIAGDIQPQQFETNLGEVRAYRQEDIETAFEKAPQLVLRSARLVGDRARQTPELQQQFSEDES